MGDPTASASSSRSTQTPSADSLAFSAQLYTSQIESWIPADFGSSSRPFDISFNLNTNADQDGNLGIGHPSLDIPKHKRQDHGVGQLEKMLGLNKKGKGKAEEGGILSTKSGKEEDEDEEEESRGSIGKKRKLGVVDLLAGKKKAKAKMKAQSETGAQRSFETISKVEQKDNVVIPSSTSKVDLEQSPVATPTTSQDTQELSTIPDPSTSSPNTTLTKNQRKALRKKQKKQAAQTRA